MTDHTPSGLQQPPTYAECYVCGQPMDGTSEDDCHCFHRKEFATPQAAHTTGTSHWALWLADAAMGTPAAAEPGKGQP